MSNARVPNDWNPVVHILDELSEGAHSVTELLYSADHYDSQAYLDAMLFLVSRQLVQFTLQLSIEPLFYDEAADVFQKAILVAQEQRDSFSQIDVDLTKAGEQVLALLELGHP